MTITTINPATGIPLADYEETGPTQFDAALDQAVVAARSWRATPPADRVEGVRRLAGALREQRDALALLASREMGKPLAGSRAEVEKCTWTFEWFPDDGPAMLEREEMATEAARSYVDYSPLGVLFGIMPWNFPYWQVGRALAPGNIVVLKDAPPTTGCALALGQSAAAPGLPEGVSSLLVAGFEELVDLVGALVNHVVAWATLLGG
jgi:succinate-semialdehyde dehydrogenase / glutarate-semialdehyde dehydrogenase